MQHAAGAKHFGTAVIHRQAFIAAIHFLPFTFYLLPAPLRGA
jgi:hypothetical protein